MAGRILCLGAVAVLVSVAGLGCGRSDLRGVGDCLHGLNASGLCQPSGSSEICGNGIDDDGNGLADCDDPACAQFSFCSATGREICNNGIDDDHNGLIDCEDPACARDASCRNRRREICDNNVDDNGNGLVDCDDPDCANSSHCKRRVENCSNGIDDDGNGLIDCQDPACKLDPTCGGIEFCGNGIDDDGDGLVDCADPDCAADPRCASLKENCSNGVDDDGDGLVDCDDPDCFGDPACIVVGREICNNGLDDDDDGLVDCDDPDCAKQPICQIHGEICDNGIDDDGDGATDCADPDCTNAPNCRMSACQPEVDFGELPQRGARSERSFQTIGHRDSAMSTCVAPGGGDVVATFTLDGLADVKVDWKQTGDHVFSLFAAGAMQTCDANPRGCFDTGAAPTGSLTMIGLQPGTYFFISEAFAAGQEGTLDVTLSTGSAMTAEICGNGIDDDGDGAIDCMDSDCVNDPACTNQLCKVDQNLGAVVPNGPPASGQLTTVGAGDDNALTCAAGGGEDVVFRFSLPRPSGVTIDVQQTGDHVIGIFTDAGPGTRCTAGQGGCIDLQGVPGPTRIVAGNLSAGTYYVILDAQKPGAEGEVAITVTAFANRGVELCDNGIDDDGDGLVDCDDPDCNGVLGCAGAVCKPDQDLGALPPDGAGAMFSVDTTQGLANQRVSCAIGGGKDDVIAVTLTALSNLTISCQQTGDHVIALFSAGGPRDRCDTNEISCADLSEPLGCDFTWPGLFPGTYYLVVQAFQPGGEGTVSAFLTVSEARTLEICDNGIDDDGDGLTDCDDPNCATFPACAALTCKPDQAIGFLPINGVPRDVSVSTVRSGSDQDVSCQSQPDGNDVVIGFSLGEAADVQVAFGQFGNHDVALFSDAGAGHKCDAQSVGCQSTGGAATGTAQFVGLAPGGYFLVIKADSPGNEGSVALRITATN